jgi:hypothetical protein
MSISDTIDVYGLPVGVGGLCIIRREAHMPSMIASGLVAGALPPLLVIALIVGAIALGVDVLGDTTASMVAFAAILAVVFLTPTAVSRPLMRRWATFECRYEISPTGLRRSAAPSEFSKRRLPPDLEVAWSDVVISTDDAGFRLDYTESVPIIPWRTRKIRLHGGQPPLVISGFSDWLNPWPAVEPLTAHRDAAQLEAGSPDIDYFNLDWTRLSFEDFLAAVIAEFALAYGGERSS